jgi:hypothetical protein
MRLKEATERGHITAVTWSGLAAPAVAGAAVHYTGPWYVVIPAVVVGLGLTILRWHRRGGGPSGRGPFGGS